MEQVKRAVNFLRSRGFSYHEGRKSSGMPPGKRLYFIDPHRKTFDGIATGVGDLKPEYSLTLKVNFPRGKTSSSMLVPEAKKLLAELERTARGLLSVETGFKPLSDHAQIELRFTGAPDAVPDNIAALFEKLEAAEGDEHVAARKRIHDAILGKGP